MPFYAGISEADGRTAVAISATARAAHEVHTTAAAATAADAAKVRRRKINRGHMHLQLGTT